MDADKIIALCLRRGIIFPSNEIYGTFSGFFDFGPIGSELKRNIENLWWKFFVKDEIVGIDGAIVTSPKIWEASGHLKSFHDPLVECQNCKKSFRADHLVEGALNINVDGLSIEKINEIIEKEKIVCPDCHGKLTFVREFNLMFKTHVGPVEDSSSEAYLRPETAQLIFINFKRVAQSSRKKLPFGIAQIGKVFRNEISPRNFVFRAREFTQMEIEYFIHPEKINECKYFDGIKDMTISICTQKMQEEGKHDDILNIKIEDAIEKRLIGTKWHAYWIARCLQYFYSIGIRKEKLRVRQHLKDELSHYSTETWDIEYKYPWGWKELMGIANRTDFDLKQHSSYSGEDLSYFDEEKKERIIPYVIEPSFGVERLVFTLLLEGYEEVEIKGEKRIFLRLNRDIAPIKLGIFPLMKRDGLPEKAIEVYDMLKGKYKCEYDESGSIGKRYARCDEIGVPYCITIDYQTLQDDTVTLRDRDTMQQERVKISELIEKLSKLFSIC
jgi:glycyl-tRNA synthetase